MLIDNPFIDNPPVHQVVSVKKKRKGARKVLIGKDKPIFIRSEDIKELRTFILTLSSKISLNLENFLSTIHYPYQNPFLYSYYLLVDSKQLAIDYLPSDIQEQIIPKLKQAINFEIKKAKRSLKRKISENNIWKSYLKSLQQVSFNFNKQDMEFAMKNLTPKASSFYETTQKYLLKFQDLEKKEMGSLLTPYIPLDREINFLAEIIRHGDKELIPYIKPMANVLLSYKEIDESLKGKKRIILKKVNRDNLKFYRFYIDQLNQINF